MVRRVFRPTCRPRSLTAKRKPPRPRSQRSRDVRKKTGRSIRCAARMRPLEKSPNRFRALASGQAPALHALRLSHNPCLETYPFDFACARPMRPLSVGRLENAFHQAKHHPIIVPISCKEISSKFFSQKTASALREGRQSGRDAHSPPS